jgi:cytoskeletal protein CcmA (bactofilin family)
MKGFLAGFGAAVLLCCVVVAAWLVTGAEEQSEFVTHSVSVDEPADEAPLAPAAGQEEIVPSTRRRVDVETSALRPGEIALRPGEGFRCADRRVVDADEAPDADLVCLDIHGLTAFLRPVHGGGRVSVPVIVAGELPPVATLFDRLESATVPETTEVVPLVSPEVNENARHSVTLLMVVKDAAGRLHKLHITAVENQAEVWRRVVRLRYAEIRIGEEPFAIPVPEAVVARPLSAGDVERVAKLIEAPGVPNLQFTNFADGKHLVVDELTEDLTIRGQSRDLLVRQRLDREIEVNARSSIALGGGIGPEGRVNTRTYSAVLVDGNVDGEIEANSYTYVRITGDVVGKLNVRSYATVVVDGALRGEVELSSYATLVVLGDVPEPKRSIRVRSRCTLYLGRYTTQESVMSIGPIRAELIHLRTSDLAAGEHTLGGKPVIVGDPLWAELR